MLQLTDPAREMTVQDLLRHTSGLIYGTRGKSLVNAAYIEAKIGSRDVNNEELVTKLSNLPLRFSPGDRWEYGVSTDVLGRLVEVVSGKTLGEFLDERILTPLGMTDTGFFVPPDKLNRAAQPWQMPEAPPMTPRFDVAQKPSSNPVAAASPVRWTIICGLRSCSPTAANSPASACSAARRSNS